MISGVHRFSTFCAIGFIDWKLEIFNKVCPVDWSKFTEGIDLRDVSIASKTVANIFNEVDKALKTQGIGIREWRILDVIAQSDFVSPSYISKKLDFAPSAVSKSLELLEINGLIKRSHLADQDRRVVELKCSQRGREVWQFGNTASNRIVKQLCSV